MTVALAPLKPEDHKNCKYLAVALDSKLMIMVNFFKDINYKEREVNVTGPLDAHGLADVVQAAGARRRGEQEVDKCSLSRFIVIGYVLSNQNPLFGDEGSNK